MALKPLLPPQDLINSRVSRLDLNTLKKIKYQMLIKFAFSFSKLSATPLRFLISFFFILFNEPQSISIVATLQIFVDLKGIPLTFHVLVSFITMNRGKGVVFFCCCCYISFNAGFEESHRDISGIEEKLMGQEWDFKKYC